MTDRLRLRISPCPNDTFMFEALLNGRIPTQGLAFEVGFQDIEELNEGVSSPDGPDISKISYAVLPAVVDRYALLDSGSALGRGNGQLLVRRRGDRSPIRRVAIPGELTTANAMLLRFFPSIVDRTPVLFSEIAAAVERGAFDAVYSFTKGVLPTSGTIWNWWPIWERCGSGRRDCRCRWRHRASRELPAEVRRTFDRVLHDSIAYALEHPTVSRPFVREHARELDDEVIDRHIALFVNRYSLALGEEGRRAVRELTGLPDLRLGWEPLHGS